MVEVDDRLEGNGLVKDSMTTYHGMIWYDSIGEKKG